MEPGYRATELVTGEQQEFLRWRAQRESLGKVRHLSWWFALAFFLETVLMFAAQDIAYAFWNAMEMTGYFDSVLLWEVADELFGITYYLIVFLPPYLLFAKLGGFRLREIPHGKPYPPVALAGTGFCMGVSLAGSYITVIALTFFDRLGMHAPQMPGLPSSALAMGLYLVNTLILPPICEELVYRGILLGSLRRYGDLAAIVISSLLFGLAHGNMAQMPYSFILGMTMAFFVIKTNSIYTSIFIHFVNNALATFMELFTQHLSDAATYMVGSLESLLDVAVFVLALIYLIGVRKADWKIYAGSGDAPASAVTRRFFFTLPMLLVLAVMGFNILSSFT